MGPNGAGKSTLANVILNNPEYKKTSGKIELDGEDITNPLMRFLEIDSTCRASFYFYNTKEDVDRLVKALNKAYNMFRKYIED
jgi:ABC-type multidrug transport system ATPase subunit